MNISPSENRNFDIIVVGSGFAGSLAAICLARSGFHVCLVEKNSHPRFAIGESSTPIADMILRSLSREYDLPWLYPLSRYGSWRREYPKLTCGLKRGFSYFLHRNEEPFQCTANHDHELLVAASGNDEMSDTNWFRSDLDAFLVSQAAAYGVTFHEETGIRECNRTVDGRWKIELHSGEMRTDATARFLIDATGSSRFSEQFLGTENMADTFLTDSEACFTHLAGAEPWTNILQTRPGVVMEDYPFQPDHSALHHLIDEGWVWMLRFTNGLLSLGIVLDRNREVNQNRRPGEPRPQILDRYPSLNQILLSAVPAPEPGQWIDSGRLQRRLSHTYGNGWAALNHTAGFVDPLHSTGIAHSLSG
ncbi:MAG: FAD-dependent oxidoreductase, partial [Balneolaceae bacterium]